jgi:hypothetical protein
MKTIHYVVAGFVGFSSVLHAQTAPPVKMGLWQTTVATTMNLELPPDVVERMKAAGRPVPGSSPMTTVVQGCLTPEKWKDAWTRSQQQGNCEMKNLKQDAAGISMDVECKTARGTSTGHTQLSFDSSEKAHGTSHMEIVSERSPKPTVMNMVMDSVYQGADCKGISPDSPKIMSH